MVVLIFLKNKICIQLFGKNNIEKQLGIVLETCKLCYHGEHWQNSIQVMIFYFKSGQLFEAAMVTKRVNSLIHYNWHTFIDWFVDELHWLTHFSIANSFQLKLHCDRALDLLVSVLRCSADDGNLHVTPAMKNNNYYLLFFYPYTDVC